ncbi:AAA family ATPase [Candidatus Kaiserbacteria bacterium]|nr:AAA family ATPase [Candidatus Kaiserbacteria bacterium]
MKLVIINGPSGIGKSTLAERLYKAMPLSLLLDIDAQRRLISGYREHRKKSYELSFAFCFAATRTYLEAGHDVIIDKIILDTGDKLDALERVGEECGATVYEFILNATKETVTQRAHERGFREGGLLTPKRVEEFWHSTQRLIPNRPRAVVIDAEKLNADEVYKKAAAIVLKH